MRTFWTNNSSSDYKTRKSWTNWFLSPKGAGRRFRMPSPLLIILGLLVIFMVLTWVVPHNSIQEMLGWSFSDWQLYLTDGTISGTAPVVGDANYVEYQYALDIIQGAPPGLYTSQIPYYGNYGILDLGLAIYSGFFSALGIIIYLLVISALLSIVMENKALQGGIASILRKLKGREIIMIPVLFVIFAILGGVVGFQEETIALYAVVCPFMLISGFSSRQAIGVLLLGTATGIITSPVNPFATGLVLGDSGWTALASGVTVVTNGTGLIFRLIMFVVVTGVGATWITVKAAKTHKENLDLVFEQQEEYDQYWLREISEGDDQLLARNDRRQNWALVVVGLAYLVVIIGVIPWSSITAIPQWWQKYMFWLTSSFTEIGVWDFGEMTTVFLVAIVAVGFILGWKKGNVGKYIFKGITNMLMVAVILGFARSISTVIIYTGFAYHMGSVMAGGLSGLPLIWFFILLFLVFLIVGIIVPSTSGSYAIMFPIIIPLINAMVTNDVDGAVNADQLIRLAAGSTFAYTAGLGIANMFTPVQATVGASAEISKVPYEVILKDNLPYAGFMCVVVIGVGIPLITYAPMALIGR